MEILDIATLAVAGYGIGALAALALAISALLLLQSCSSIRHAGLQK